MSPDVARRTPARRTCALIIAGALRGYGGERYEIAPAQRRLVGVDDRQRFVRIDRRRAMTGKVLVTRNDAAVATVRARRPRQVTRRAADRRRRNACRSRCSPGRAPNREPARNRACSRLAADRKPPARRRAADSSISSAAPSAIIDGIGSTPWRSRATARPPDRLRSPAAGRRRAPQRVGERANVLETVALSPGKSTIAAEAWQRRIEVRAVQTPP